MGRKSTTGGVCAAGQTRIQFTFKLGGIRYRPTLRGVPSEGNLRRARAQLAEMKQRIALGMFSFAEEFPAYRYLKNVPQEARPRTCMQVFDEFLAHCESRVAKDDMAPITLSSYRRVLNGIWWPRIGELRFLGVQYSTLVKIADEADWSKRSYNNSISVLRRAFKSHARAEECANPEMRSFCYRSLQDPGSRSADCRDTPRVGTGSRQLR